MIGGFDEQDEDAEDSSALDYMSSERECMRIAELPPRAPVEDLTPYFRRPGGTMQLNDEQNGALMEIGINGGALISLPVGMGKTLISFLAAEAIRFAGEGVEGFIPPYEIMLLTKASIREQTLREIESMSRHFKFAPPRVYSYSELSSQRGRNLLDQVQPDLIICDEAHTLASRISSRSKRFRAYARNYTKLLAHDEERRRRGEKVSRRRPPLRFVFLSGSFVKEKIAEFAHLTELVLGQNNLVPRNYKMLQAWDRCLSHKTSSTPSDQRHMVPFVRAMGVRVNSPETEEFRAAARDAFKARFTDTSGVVTTDKASTDVPLEFHPWNLDVPQEVLDAVHRVDSMWERPDGETFPDVLSKMRYIEQLLQGFFLFWKWPNDKKDEEWIFRRSQWFKELRAFLTSRAAVQDLDSPGLVESAMKRKKLHGFGNLDAAWAQWCEVSHRPVPPTHSSWISTYMVDAVRAFVAQSDAPTLIWTSSVELRNALGRHFPVIPRGDRPPDKPVTCVLSVASHGTGLNLQQFRRNLFTSLPTDAKTAEQAIGRTHRQGQLETVEVFFPAGNRYFDRKPRALCASAAYIQASTGSVQKVLTGKWFGDFDPNNEDDDNE